MQELLIFSLLVVLIFMTLVWVIASLRLNNSYADVAWGIIFIIIGASIVLTNQDNKQFYYIFIPIIIWGSRLAWHIGQRNLFSSEDRRYADWRKKGGKNYQLKSLLSMFWLQGILAMVIATPLFIASQYGYKPSVNSYFGVFVWFVGFVYESTADRQFRHFLNKRQAKNEIMNQGLWNYSRHPNYFGEIIQWIGLFIANIGLEHWYIGIISPVLITFLLKYISGVPLAEKSLMQNPKYRQYASKTPPIFPINLLR